MDLLNIEDIKEDWEKVKKRYEAWWACELYDRILVQVTAPREGVKHIPVKPSSVEAMWTDIDYIIRRILENVRTTYYGGESVPLLWHNWSAGHALLLGCEPKFAWDTVWVDPVIAEEEYPEISFSRENHWWKWMRDSTRTAAQASKGRYFVMAMWGNHAGDNLALARGTEQLLMDIALNPEWVRLAVKTVSDILIEVYEELWQIVSPEVTGLEGSVNYCGCWSPGRTHGFDCDMSCMISPKAFRDLFLPPLVETMRTVDHRIYHLDGPGAIHHLDTLLDLPELHAIQWVPGSGAMGGIMQWVPLIKRVQNKGKGIVVYAGPGEVEPLLREVRPEGLCIGTSCNTEAEARELLELVARLSKMSITLPLEGVGLVLETQARS